MGGVIGKAADDVGGFIGNAFAAPFKAVLGRSCKNVCSGPWDVTCFIEHFCIADLAKLVMISGLCFIVLMFFYLLFKLGVCKCMVKSLCKMSCAVCEAYWCTILDMAHFLWYKLKNTKRVRRRRRLRDIEAAGAYSSSDEYDFSDGHSPINISRKRRRELGKKNAGEISSLHSRRHNHHCNHSRSRHGHIKLRSREMSVRVGEKSRIGRKARTVKLARGTIHNRTKRVKSIKKRRIK